MGLFKKKPQNDPYELGADGGGPDVFPKTSFGGSHEDPFPAAGTAPPEEPAMHSGPSTTPTIGAAVHTAKEETMSTAGVAVLSLWMIAVTGWTGFQVVQNALWNSRLASTKFAFKEGDKALRLVTLLGDPGLWLEVNGLYLIIAIEAALTVTFFALGAYLLLYPAFQACRQGTRPRRMKRSFLVWFLTLVLVGTAWLKAFVISSMWNKMEYQGLFCTTGTGAKALDLSSTFQQGQSPPPAGCQLDPIITPMRMGLVFALLTIAFHMLLYFWRQPLGTCGKALGALPAILLVAFFLLKPVTSIMNFRETQRFYTTKGNFTFTGEMIVALIEFLSAVWLSLYMGWASYSLRLLPRFTNTLLACCGRQYEDVYYEHSRNTLHHQQSNSDPHHAAEIGGASSEDGNKCKSYSLRAASKAMLQQYYYMTQLPTVFGFVSPMITYFALGVKSWWVVFDIIVGAVFVGLYMMLCAGHRKILAPSKH